MARRDTPVSKVKTDCFAFVDFGKCKKCTALEELECEKGSCKFYKSRRQLYEENRKRRKKYDYA